MKALLVPTRYAGCLANFRFCPEHPAAHVSGHLFSCPGGDQGEGLLFAHRLAPRFMLCFLSTGRVRTVPLRVWPSSCHMFMSVARLVGVRASALLVGRGTGPLQQHRGVMSSWGDSNREGGRVGVCRGQHQSRLLPQDSGVSG